MQRAGLLWWKLSALSQHLLDERQSLPVQVFWNRILLKTHRGCLEKQRHEFQNIAAFIKQDR